MIWEWSSLESPFLHARCRHKNLVAGFKVKQSINTQCLERTIYSQLLQSSIACLVSQLHCMWVCIQLDLSQGRHTIKCRWCWHIFKEQDLQRTSKQLRSRESRWYMIPIIARLFKETIKCLFCIYCDRPGKLFCIIQFINIAPQNTHKFKTTTKFFISWDRKSVHHHLVENIWSA